MNRRGFFGLSFGAALAGTGATQPTAAPVAGLVPLRTGRSVPINGQGEVVRFDPASIPTEAWEAREAVERHMNTFGGPHSKLDEFAPLRSVKPSIKAVWRRQRADARHRDYMEKAWTLVGLCERLGLIAPVMPPAKPRSVW